MMEGRRVKNLLVVVVIIIVIFLALLLSSCSTLPSVTDYSSFSSLADINDFIHHNIEYVGEWKDTDTVQSPETTLATRKGVCFDDCTLFVYLAKLSGWTVKVLPVQTTTGYHTIVDAGSSGYYDPVSGTFLGYSLPKGWSVTTF